MADVTELGGSGTALHFNSGFPRNYNWLHNAVAYTGNIVNGNLEGFIPESNKSYEVRLKYYSASAPQQKMVFSIQHTPNDTVNGKFIYSESNIL